MPKGQINEKTKFIFITGGVISSLGKGITAASIGRILESRGLKVNLMKLDPYINVDPGTMNPYQHGEVYVSEDGAETDLDLGHYERFTHARITRLNNVTSGQIYNAVISKERKGYYLGKTIQVIPHITDEIKGCIDKLASSWLVDVILVEIGGTVGDIESLPFLEAARQLSLDKGKDKVLYIHLTLVPYLKVSGEIKTKPTQHSVGTLREIGIQPDILICRTEKSLSEETKEKISLFCNVSMNSVIEALDVDCIYEIPLIFKRQGLDNLILEKLSLKPRLADLRNWQIRVVDKIKSAKKRIRIAVVGKYIQLQDAYKSIYEALTHGATVNNVHLEIVRQDSEAIDLQQLRSCSGILVPGGFGRRGIKGKIKAIRFSRENQIPFFGICLGMQCAVIEFALNVLGLPDADSTEFNKDTSHPVICLLAEQKKVKNLGGTMRLGAYPCRLHRDSTVFKAYTKDLIYERHRHRYEFNNHYRKQFKKAGMFFSGVYPGRNLVEIIEIKGHPWFVAVQFHPEFKSKPDCPHPLFREFIKSAIEFSSRT